MKKSQRNSKSSKAVLSVRDGFPMPRLPRAIGSDRFLSSKASVYPVVQLDIPLQPTVITLVAGAVAQSVAIDVSVLALFGKLGQAFREYAIVGARLEIRPNNLVAPAGVTIAFLDETSAAAPAASDAKDRPKLDMLNAALSVPGGYRLDWTPRDILDLDYVSTGTTFTPLWLKFFASVADTFTLATTTGQYIVTGALALTFRGYV